jgi:hypothetical protein
MLERSFTTEAQRHRENLSGISHIPLESLLRIPLCLCASVVNTHFFV